MDLVVALVVTSLSASATLVLVSLGLAVIFGVMQVVNLAHGEFMVIGAFVSLVLSRAGAPWWLGLVVAPMVVALIALAVERLIIRFLYGRLIETMLATWGLSLVLVQVLLLLFGSSARGAEAPLGSFLVGSYSISEYSLVLIAAALVLPLLLYLIFTRTPYGVLARAVAQNEPMAAALGVDVALVRAGTFMLGAGLAGLAGALLSAVVSVVPTMGQGFIASAFMTVIVAGPAVISGTLLAALGLGVAQSLASFWQTAVIGQAALLVVAILVLRVRPTGISGTWRRQL